MQITKIIGAGSVTGLLFLVFYVLHHIIIKISASMNEIDIGNKIGISVPVNTLLNWVELSIFVIIITLHLLTSATLKTIFYRYFNEGFVSKDLAPELLEDAIKKKI